MYARATRIVRLDKVLNLRLPIHIDIYECFRCDQDP